MKKRNFLSFALVATLLLSACSSNTNAPDNSTKGPLFNDPSAAAQDSLALVDLYNATAGDKWYHKDGWLSDKPLDEWYGVKTERIGGASRVTVLRLGANNLKGTIPATIGKLVMLRVLDLGYNYNLVGELPQELYELKGLDVLKLRFASIEGTISPLIGNFTRIDTLDLSKSKYSETDPRLVINPIHFTGGLPKEIGNLTKARYIDISYNKLGGKIPTEITKLTIVRHLNLAHCAFEGTIPSGIGALKSVREFYMGDNALVSPLPESLSELSVAKELFLNDNKFSGEIPASFGKLNKLENLYLNGNAFTGSIPSELANMSSLYVLYLNDNQLSGEYPAELGGAMQPNMIRVDVSNNNLTGSLPARVKKYSEVPNSGLLPDSKYGYTTITIYGNRLTGIVPEEYLKYKDGYRNLVPQQSGYGFDNLSAEK